jgi:hypothetical protein
MSNGWERLLASDLASGTVGNLLANLISSAAVEFYKQSKDLADDRRGAARLSDVRESVRSLLVDVRGKDEGVILPAIRQFTTLPNSSNTLTEFRRFMQTSDFEFVVADVVSEHILNGTVGDSTLRHIALTLRLHALPDLPPAIVLDVSRELAEIIVTVVKGSSDDPARPSLAASDTRAHLRQTAHERVLRRIDLLTNIVDTESKSIANIEGNVAKLRKSVATVHSTMRPPSIETAKKVAVEELYVGQTLNVAGSAEVRLPDGLPARLVVLGNPGGGKTSFVNYLSYVTSNSIPTAQPNITIPVVLRENAGEVSASSGLNLLRAAARSAHAKYQVRISESELEYLCLHGRTLFILDGLDELLDLDQRSAVASAVEAFSALYPECRLVVTSREVGYEMAGINRRTFTHATLAPFDTSQVREYANKWFQQAEDLTLHMRESFVDSFMVESGAIPDLRENPLMLSLLCGLYRHQRSIPSNRPELYEKCSTLLFDTWDRRRRLRPRFEFDAHVKLAIQHLALWIFTDQERQAGVLEKELVREAANYFHEWLYDDKAVAEASAQDFVSFCRNRAWVLTDTGTATGGSPLFQFTHRTFMEYFTALHLNHTLTDSDIVDLLVRRCADSPWNVVSQILIQLAWQRRQGLADQIVQAICRGAGSLLPAEQALADELCVRVIESTPLKPETVRIVVKRAISRFVSKLRTDVRSQYPDQPIPGREAFWIDSSKLAVENYRAARPVVVNALAESMATSEAPLREASHFIEFMFTDGCSPLDLRHEMPEETGEVLTRYLARRAPEAWIECSALILQLDRKLTGHRGMALGNRTSDISPIRGMWGNRDLPNASEISSWLLVHDQLAPDSPTLDNCNLIARAALRHMKNASRRLYYTPHPIWTAMQQVDEVRAASPLPTAPLLLLLGLVETALAGCTNEDGRRDMLFHLVAQPWGRCTVVPYLIAERYRMKTRGFSPVLRREAERTGADAWCADSRPSAVELSSRLV